MRWTQRNLRSLGVAGQSRIRGHASQRELAAGSVVAVYDLGGGTFDAAVARAVPGGFEILGRPEGLEALGDIDFDYAVLSHVAQVAGIDLDTIEAGHHSVGRHGGGGADA